MSVLVLCVILFVLIFGFVVFFGPPYLPTKRRQIIAALDLLDLQPGETMLELGSGDGRVVMAAAKRGWYVVGIELNPLLVLISKVHTWRYRKRVRIIWGDYFRVAWPDDASGIFAFLVPRHMAKLDARIVRWHKHRRVRLASFAFTIPDKKPVQRRQGVLLYEYR